MTGTDTLRRRRAGWFALAVAAVLGVESIVATAQHQGFWGPVLALVAIGCLGFGLRDIVGPRRR